MVEEIKVNQKIEEKKEVKEPTYTEKTDILWNAVKKGKIKKLKFPSKVKVSGGRIKKGYIGILKIDENGNLTGEKVKLEDSTFKLKDEDYHSTNGGEILLLNGKIPVIIQPTWRANPLNLRKEVSNLNETYGQKYIKAKLLKETLKEKKNAGWVIWIIVAIVAFVGINYLMKKGVF